MPGRLQMPSLVERAIAVVFFVAMLAAALIGLALASIGIWELGRASVKYLSSGTAAAIGTSLKGIEFLFLAPVPYVVVLTIVRYLRAVQTGSDEELSARRVTSAKAFVAALMVGILATDLISRALSPEGLTYEVALCEVAGIAVLIAFFVVLEHLAHRAHT